MGTNDDLTNPQEDDSDLVKHLRKQIAQRDKTIKTLQVDQRKSSFVSAGFPITQDAQGNDVGPGALLAQTYQGDDLTPDAIRAFAAQWGLQPAQVQQPAPDPSQQGQAPQQVAGQPQNQGQGNTQGQGQVNPQGNPQVNPNSGQYPVQGQPPYTPPPVPNPTQLTPQQEHMRQLAQQNAAALSNFSQGGEGTISRDQYRQLLQTNPNEAFRMFSEGRVEVSPMSAQAIQDQRNFTPIGAGPGGFRENNQAFPIPAVNTPQGQGQVPGPNQGGPPQQ